MGHAVVGKLSMVATSCPNTALLQVFFLVLLYKALYQELQFLFFSKSHEMLLSTYG